MSMVFSGQRKKICLAGVMSDESSSAFINNMMLPVHRWGFDIALDSQQPGWSTTFVVEREMTKTQQEKLAELKGKPFDVTRLQGK